MRRARVNCAARAYRGDAGQAAAAAKSACQRVRGGGRKQNSAAMRQSILR